MFNNFFISKIVLFMK